MAWTNENPNEETIKCVVVGDNNVGKTRLICSRAYSHKEHTFSFKKYGGSHVPTVWAIDQYRNNKDVLNSARSEIDDVLVSLRLWDTFGDHHKDRRFAYGRADVAIVCFSVCDRKSLHNIKHFWLKEIREHCKKIPVFIVACKADLRFVDLDELNRHRSRLTREIKYGDLVFPEESRAFAKELDYPYYESSVLLDYGIDHVFDNAIRAALMYRRGLYFWKSTLKRVKRPFLQQPLLPAKPPAPPLTVPLVKQGCDTSILLKQEICTDATIICHGYKFRVHKVILSVASQVFYDLLSNENPSKSSRLKKSSGSSSLLGHNDFYVINLNEIKERENVAIDTAPKLVEVKSTNSELTYLKIDEAVSINSQLNSNSKINDEFTSITLIDEITPETFCKVLELCYNGYVSFPTAITKYDIQSKNDFMDALRYFDINTNESNNSDMIGDYQNIDFEMKQLIFLSDRSRRLSDLFLFKPNLTDVEFEVDDGIVSAHKALLVSGCEMMSAMFSGKFTESFNNKVSLPGTFVNSLKTAIEFIYTGSSSFTIPGIDFIDLIALANRLCLPQLIKQIEYYLVQTLQSSINNLKEGVIVPKEICSNIIDLLEVSQIHNADELVSWCLHFLCIYYNDMCKQCPKKVKMLSVDNQNYLATHRWPPVWYIKDKDNYDKAVKKRKLYGDENFYKGKGGIRYRSKS